MSVVESKQTILIVEDDLDLRRMFRHAIKLAGFAVREAADGSEALRIIGEDPPDLVVLDLILPMVDGVSVLGEVTTRADTRQIPIVVVTGSRLDVKRFAPSCVLRKPVSPEQLVEAIGKCLIERRDGGRA